MRLYLAGPMTGHDHFNFPAFDRTAAWLRSLGHDVVSPAEMDRELFPDHDFSSGTVPEGFDKHKIIENDCRAINEVDGVYFMHGWEQSKGANVEHAMAIYLDKEIFYEDTPCEPIPYQQPVPERIKLEAA